MKNKRIVLIGLILGLIVASVCIGVVCFPNNPENQEIEDYEGKVNACLEKGFKGEAIELEVKNCLLAIE